MSNQMEGKGFDETFRELDPTIILLQCQNKMPDKSKTIAGKNNVMKDVKMNKPIYGIRK